MEAEPRVGMAASCSDATWSFRAVFSMKVPVPPLHADCMNTCLDFPAPAAVKKIVFMSSPPISDTNRTSGWRRSTHAATATTSWTYLPPIRAVMEPAPEPVTKTRSTPGVRPASASMRPRKSSTFSAWRVLCRW